MVNVFRWSRKGGKKKKESSEDHSAGNLDEDKNEGVSVEEDHSVAVEEDHSVAVEEDHSVAVGEDHSVAVRGDQSVAGSLAGNSLRTSSSCPAAGDPDSRLDLCEASTSSVSSRTSPGRSAPGLPDLFHSATPTSRNEKTSANRYFKGLEFGERVGNSVGDLSSQSDREKIDGPRKSKHKSRLDTFELYDKIWKSTGQLSSRSPLVVSRKSMDNGHEEYLESLGNCENVGHSTGELSNTSFSATTRRTKGRLESLEYRGDQMKNSAGELSSRSLPASSRRLKDRNPTGPSHSPNSSPRDKSHPKSSDKGPRITDDIEALRKDRDVLKIKVNSMEKKLKLARFEIKILKGPKVNAVHVGQQTEALGTSTVATETPIVTTESSTMTTQPDVGKKDPCQQCEERKFTQDSETRGVFEMNQFLKKEMKYLRDRFENEREQNNINELNGSKKLEEKEAEIEHYKEMLKREKLTNGEKTTYFVRCEKEHQKIIAGLREELRELAEKLNSLQKTAGGCKEQLEKPGKVERKYESDGEESELEPANETDFESESDIQKLRFRITALNEANRKSKKDNGKHRREQEKFVEEMNIIQEKCKTLEEEKISLEEEILMLKEQANPKNLKDRITELEYQKDNLEERLCEISDYRMYEIQILQKDLEESQENLRSAESSKAALEKQRCDLKSEIVEMKLQLSGKSNEVIGKLKEEISELKRKQIVSATEREDQETDQRIQKLEKEKRCLECQLKMIRSGGDEVNILRTQLMVSEGKLNKSSVSVQELESDNKKLHEKLNELEKQVESQKAEAQKTETNTSLPSDVEHLLTDKVHVATSLKKELAKLGDENRHLNQEKARLSTELVNMKAEVEKLTKNQSDGKTRRETVKKRLQCVQVCNNQFEMKIVERKEVASQTYLNANHVTTEIDENILDECDQQGAEGPALKLTESLNALRTENSTMMNKVDQIMSKYLSLENEKRKLETKVQEVMKGKTMLRNVLKKEFDSHGKTRKAYRNKIVTLNQKIKKLLEDLEHERDSARSSMQTAHEFEKRYSEIENERVELAAKLESHKIIEYETLSPVIKEETNQNDVIKSISAPVPGRDFEERRDCVDLSKSDKVSERETHQDYLFKVRKELRSSQQLIRRYEFDLSQAIDSISKTKSELEESKNEIEDLKSKLENGDNQWVVVNIVQEEKMTGKESGDFGKDCCELEMTLKQTKSNLARVSKEFDQTCIELLKTHEKLSEKMNEVEDLMEKLQESGMERKKQDEEINVLRINLEHAQAELDKREEDIDICRIQNEHFDQLQTDVEKSRNETDSAKKVLDHVTEELRKATKTNDRKLLEERKYFTEVDNLRWKLRDFEVKEKKLLTEIRQLTQRSNTAHCALSNALEKTNQDLFLANQTIIDERKCTVEMKTERAKLQERIENLQEEMRILKRNEKFDSNSDELVEREKSNLYEELDNLREEIKRLNGNGTLKYEFEMAKQEILHLQKTISNNNEQIAILADELYRIEQDLLAEKSRGIQDRRSYEAEKEARWKLVEEIEVLHTTLESALKRRLEDERRIVELNAANERLASTASELEISNQITQMTRKALSNAQRELKSEILNSKDKIISLKHELRETKLDRDQKVNVIQQLSEKLENHERIVAERTYLEKERNLLEEEMESERSTSDLLKDRSIKIWKLLKMESEEKRKAVHRIQVLESEILQCRGEVMSRASPHETGNTNRSAEHRPSIPAVSADHRPSIPAVSADNRPSIPAVSADNRPSIPADHRPSKPAVSADNRPSIPAVSADHRPSIPAVSADHRPSKPAVSADHRPSIPAVSADHRPFIPTVSADHRPSKPAVVDSPSKAELPSLTNSTHSEQVLDSSITLESSIEISFDGESDSYFESSGETIRGYSFNP